MVSAYTIGMLIEDKQGIATFDTKWIWLSCLIILGLVILRFVFDYFRAKFQETISYELVARDRLAVGDALKRVSLGYFQKMDTGHILNSITTGLSTLENMGIRMLDTVIGGYLNFLCIFLCLFFVNPLVSLISVLGVGLSFVFLLVVSKHSKENAPKSADAVRNLTNAALKVASIGLVISSLCLGLSGQMDIKMTLIFAFFSLNIFASLEPISDGAHTLGVIDDAMDQLDVLKNDESYIDGDGKDIKLSNFDIEFKNVNFGYDTRQILKDVNFKISENTSTAIVGPSGSGKSTICNLIARFYDVNSGSISIGGHNLKEFTCDSLLSNISMVFQNVYLFNDTIRNNICFGNPNATEEDMIAVAKKACCHDFISKLPNGYDTVIGEGGGTLSGGEKQRISIARAMLKNAPIIILDEATASIDPENEHLIQSAISELTKGKTVITIAHRLATIENADCILVVDDGRIVQQGNHEELIKQEGKYRDFINVRKRVEKWNIYDNVKH